MLINRWHVRFTSRTRRWPTEPRPLLVELGKVDEWLDGQDIPDGAPFLIGPDGVYDVVLNSYFLSFRPGTPRRLWLGTWLVFWTSCGFTGPVSGDRKRSWRDATPDDRRVFEFWRCRDENGPLVAASTWDREVSSVNGFYRWAVRSGHLTRSPMVQRPSRSRPERSRWSQDSETSAERRPDVRRDRVAWLTPRAYRTWRDVGLRGYCPDGLPDPAFRGRRVARNHGLCRHDDPHRVSVGGAAQPDAVRATGAGWLLRLRRTWLPAAIAKLGSARNIYFPDSVLRDLWAYVDIDRAEAVASSQAAGRYEQIADPLLVEHPTRAAVRLGGRWVGVDRLDPAQRSRLLRATPDGLEPAVLWLGEDGMPLTVRAWKSVFRTASDRCRLSGVPIYCHPHMLRHVVSA